MDNQKEQSGEVRVEKVETNLMPGLVVKGGQISYMEISGVPHLDPILAYWKDYEPGRGAVTLTCYGSAWTCYFGAMSGKTIREFFSACDTGYLVNKLGISDVLKRGKREQNYLGRVIEAVQAAIAKAEGRA